MSPLNNDPVPVDADAVPSATAKTACGQALSSEDLAAATAAPARSGQAYWRSLDEFTGSPEFAAALDREFPSVAQDLVTADDRRQFMKVMGASFAMAGLTLAGCRRWPEQQIAPFANRPENRTPGQSVGYATSMELGGFSTGLVVTSFDGRPIKIEGNSLHPASGGGTLSAAQGSVLELYDPDRSRTVLHRGEASSLAAFDAFLESHATELDADGGAGFAILAEASGSPSLRAMHERLRERCPRMRWVEWEPVNDDNERAGTEIALGAPHRVHLSLHDGRDGGARSRVTLSLGSDFLLDHRDAARLTREHARTRRVDHEIPKQQSLGRLYSVDSGGTITAASSDNNIAVRSVDVVAVAAMITEGLLDALGCGTPSVGANLARLSASSGAAEALDEHDREIVAQIVEDLLESDGESAVVVGRNQPPAVHALACLMNERLGNVGRTVKYIPVSDADRPSMVEGLRQLVAAMGDGSVRTLAVIGANPVYTAPADIDFGAALRSVPTSIHLGLHVDETGLECTWHLPRAHYLECWGDGSGPDGTVSVAQPLIEPLVGGGQGGLSAIELLAHLSGGGSEEPRDGHSIVRRTFAALTGTEGDTMERRWRAALHDGVVDRPELAVDASMDPARVGTALGRLADGLESLAADTIEVVFRPCAKVYDGRFANNGWLQELPEPVTKLAWDNAAVIGYRFARELGVSTGDMITLTVDGRSLEIAVMVLPGYAARSVWLALGYGRGGRIADGAGFNTYHLRSSAAPDIAVGATIAATGGRYTLVTSQDRGAGNPVADRGIQQRLPSVVREGTLAEYQDKPNFARYRTHVAHRLSLWEESNLDGAKHRWAMSVDLNTCTGCSACVIACQAENNIPVVGKEQMRRGREMHWIRIDRYFRGADPDRPDRVAFQPVACMHCEMAPCEQVCPVAATVHDEEGLNVMVYNRCIGTRYCSNNCPYKVRRFNYFDWHRMDRARTADWIQHPKDYYFRDGPDQWQRLQFNPEVTVRTRGVMEKCTFCTQRINEGRIKAKNAWARAGGRQGPTGDYAIPDGTIVPACAQACPAEAIVFGDLNDPQSKVAKLMAKPLSYEMLEELNTKPRLRYLARVRNPGVEHDRDACDHDHAPSAGVAGAATTDDARTDDRGHRPGAGA